MNLKEIRELVDLVTENGISEFELERAGVRIRISRGAVAYAGAAAPAPPQAMTASAVSTSSAPGTPSGARSTLPAASPLAPRAPGPSAAVEELFVVRSPMVGTFYSAPGQDAPPYVQVGDRVQPGQVLCIIEAMKLMNEIEAEVEGEVLKVYADNAQPVEFGEPLFDIRTVAPKRE